MATKAATAAQAGKAERKAKATGRAGVILEVDELVEPLIKKEWGMPPPSWAEILMSYKVRYAEIFIYREKYIHRYHIKLPILSDEELLLVKEALLRYLIEPRAVLEDLLRETGLPEQLVLRVRDEVLGLGVFEVLMDDPYIEDIQVIHAESPLKIIHSNFGATLSNIVLGEEYVNRIVRTALKTANIALTKIRPYRSFMGPRGYRFSVMMKSDVAPLTTSFVIRKPIRIWTLSAMTKYGSIPVIMAGFLWLAFQERLAILLTGGMMTGKTSLSNAILSSIPPTATAVIIEDTPELTPPIKALRRVPRQEKGVEITPFDLVVHALRESADYVIVGEVRGPEAAAWAQAILLGHGGLTTFHAETPESGFRRLLMPPLEVSPAALDAIYIIVHLRRLLVKGKMRRVAELYSHEGGGKLIPVIQFNPARGIHELVTPLHTIRPVKVISEKRGWTPSEVLEEIRVRAKIVKDLEKFEGSVEEYNKKLYETLYERRGTVLM